MGRYVWIEHTSPAVRTARGSRAVIRAGSVARREARMVRKGRAVDRGAGYGIPVGP